MPSLPSAPSPRFPTFRKDTPVLEIRRAAVIGAGTMGGGITMNYANAGIPVIVKETTQEALDRGMATIRKNYAEQREEGPALAGRDGSAPGADHPAAHLRWLRTGRHHRRSGLRRHGAEEAGLRRDRRDRQARLHPRVQHLLPRYRRDRLGHQPPRDGRRTSLLQPGERDAPARNRARQSHQPRSPGHLDGAGEAAEEDRRAGRQRARLHRQPHADALPARGAVPGGRGRHAWKTSTRRSTISAWPWDRSP